MSSSAVLTTRDAPAVQVPSASELSRHRYRSCQPQPTASKPAPAKEVASRTLAWQPEKTENREASARAKTPTSQGWRSRGQARKPRQHWGNGQKKSQPMRVGILGIGGAGGNDERPSTFTKFVENQALNYAFQLHHATYKVLVDGCRGRAKWHGRRSLALRTRVQFRTWPNGLP